MNRKKRLIILAVIIAIVAIAILLVKVIIPNIRLNKERKEEEAYKAAISCELKDADKGNIVKFGTYQGEDVEWLVLDKQGDKIFVTTYYAIDCKPYNEEFVEVTWEDCTLRTWLNKDFYNAAFSDEEKSMIPTTNVANKDNTKYETDGGNDTKDKVFLLSIDEVNKYFGDDGSRQCAATPYAVEEGCWRYNPKHYSKDGKGIYRWWLRSSGGHQDRAANVNDAGGVDTYGDYVDIDSDGVRPALWIVMK